MVESGHRKQSTHRSKGGHPPCSPPVHLPYRKGPAPSRTHRKKVLSRLAELLGQDLGSMFKSGLLAQAACLPAVLLTVLALLAESLPLVLLAAAAAGWLTGPAMTALYDTILRALRDEPGFWWHTYRRVWRRSFRSSLLPGVAFTALWSCLLYARLAAAPAGPLLLSAACLTAFQTYYWMQEALFERPAARQLENCLRMAAGFLPQTLAAAAVQLFCLAILPSLGLFGLLAGLWLPSLLALMLVYPPIERALGLEAKIRQVQSTH